MESLVFIGREAGEVRMEARQVGRQQAIDGMRRGEHVKRCQARGRKKLQWFERSRRRLGGYPCGRI